MNYVSKLIVLLLSLASIQAFAQDTKIGVVDLQKIMQTSPQMKTIQQDLEKSFKSRRDKLMTMEADLKNDMQKLKRDSSILTQVQKQELEKKIVEAQQTFEKEGQQYQQELSASHNEAMEGLYNKIRKAINMVAETGKYDIILQKDAAPFSVTKLDVTDSVVKNLNKD